MGKLETLLESIYNNWSLREDGNVDIQNSGQSYLEKIELILLLNLKIERPRV